MSEQNKILNSSKSRDEINRLLVFPGLIGVKRKRPLSESLKKMILATYLHEERKKASNYEIHNKAA
ncbi:MAG: hypothetical protein ACLFSQ_04560 [Candidatus Zixiibacteriota bacterium]